MLTLLSVLTFGLTKKFFLKHVIFCSLKKMFSKYTCKRNPLKFKASGSTLDFFFFFLTKRCSSFRVHQCLLSFLYLTRDGWIYKQCSHMRVLSVPLIKRVGLCWFVFHKTLKVDVNIELSSRYINQGLNRYHSDINSSLLFTSNLFLFIFLISLTILLPFNIFVNISFKLGYFL